MMSRASSNEHTACPRRVSGLCSPRRISFHISDQGAPDHLYIAIAKLSILNSFGTPFALDLVDACFSQRARARFLRRQSFSSSAGLATLYGVLRISVLPQRLLQSAAGVIGSDSGLFVSTQQRVLVVSRSVAVDH